MQYLHDYNVRLFESNVHSNLHARYSRNQFYSKSKTKVILTEKESSVQGS